MDVTRSTHVGPFTMTIDERTIVTTKTTIVTVNNWVDTPFGRMNNGFSILMPSRLVFVDRTTTVERAR